MDEHVFAAWRNEVLERGEHWPKAAELLAAYGYGKPAQTVDLGNKDDKPLSIRIIRKVTG